MAKREKVVLAYSGGLDTSVAIKWLADKYHVDVITLCVNIGGVSDVEGIRKKALMLGAIKSFAVDAKEEFISDYVFPAIPRPMRFTKASTHWPPRWDVPSWPSGWWTPPTKRAPPPWRTDRPARATTRCGSMSASSPWGPS